jgi:hypothetical protein
MADLSGLRRFQAAQAADQSSRVPGDLRMHPLRQLRKREYFCLLGPTGFLIC